MKKIHVVVALLALIAVAWWLSQSSTPDPSPRVTSPAVRSDLPASRPLPPLPSGDRSAEQETRVSRSAAENSRDFPAFLPREAQQTLALIERGGSFPHRQDGNVFQNRERRLPAQSRDYYREYTVPTPGSRDRGARRIVTGGDPPQEYWYSDDHYRSFRRFEVPR